MHQDQHTFRIFLSSTFSDLKEERNALQQRVFPRLRDLAAEHACRFQVIDLRWGVSAEASLDQQAMDICLREVARCQHTTPRPNFLVMLGDRYGWCPPPAHIPQTHFQQFLSSIPDPADRTLLQEWYFLDENAQPPEWRLKARQPGSPYVQNVVWQPVETRLHTILATAALALPFSDEERLPYIASATQQEIAAGALSVPDAQEHVLCFLRSIPDLPRHFNLPAFRTELANDLHQTYGNTPFNQHVKDLVKKLLTSPELTNPAHFASLLRSALATTPKGTIDHEVLGFLQQALVDFTAHDFINLDEVDWSIDQAALASQNALKERLTRNLPKHIFTYQAHWAGMGITDTHIEQLCDDVYHSLSALMLDQIEHPHPFPFIQEPRHLIPPDDHLDEEGLVHRRFAEERLQGFEGRSDMLNKIAASLDDPNRPLFSVIGEGGSGKSALIAKAVQQTQLSHPSAGLIYRFIGATAPSADSQNLLGSLCQELSRRYGVEDAAPPVAYSELVAEFIRRLQYASAEKPLFLFLDSLDQLSELQGARSLTWLPTALPAYVHLITSTRPDGPLEHLQARQAHIETLTGLTREEGNRILSHWLEDARRTLQSPQRQEVLDKFAQSGGNPLYLKLAFEEARLWTSQDMDPVETLTPTLDGIIAHNMLERLEKEQNHGKMLVSHALGYLAASRHGLSEDELVDLLSRDFEVYSWFFKGSQHVPPDLLQLAVAHRPQPVGRSASQDDRAAMDWLTDTRTPPESVEKFLRYVLTLPNGPHLPIVLWSRLSFDLAAYLTEHNDQGGALLTFYHRELQDVTRSVFLKDGQERRYHEQLAEYFGSHSRFSSRRIDEQAWQLARSENWQGLYDLLTDTEMMNLIWEQKKEDMLSYWTQIEHHSSLRMVEGYRTILADPSGVSAYTVLNIVRLMNELGYRQENTAPLMYLIEYYRGNHDLRNLQVTLGYLAFILQTRGDLLEALDLFKEQEELCRQISNRAGLADALGNQGVILQRRGLYNDALLKFSEQETLCRHIGHRKGLASSLGNHALILQVHGRLNEAMGLHKEEERILQELGDRTGLCRSLLNQANLLKLMGKIDEALHVLEKCHNTAKELGNQDFIQKVVGSQGEIYLKLGQFEKALQLCKQQEQICRSTQNMNDLVSALGNQAAIKLNQGSFEEALPLLDETEQLCLHLNNLPMLSLTLNNKAAILDAQGKGAEALALFQQMEQLSQRMNHMEGIIMSLVNQAITNYRYELAGMELIQNLLDKSLRLAQANGYASHEAQIREIYNKIFRAA